MLAVVLMLFLIFRLRMLSTSDISGRYLFVLGGVAVFLASTWQLLSVLPDYPNWFVPSVYPIVRIIQFAVMATGLILITVGLALYSDHWQTRRRQIEERESKLSIIENLQHDARQPYQLLELLNISLREFLYHLPGCAGSIYLLNRSQRRLVLASSSGLTKKETALLEHYPLGRNLASQAIELGDPLIGGGFDFIAKDGQSVQSRFGSCLVLPMVSGLEKIGAVLLLSEEEHCFGKTEIKYLAPVVEWLAEKVYATRLARELALSRAEVDRQTSQQTAINARIASAAASMLSADTVDEFCRSMLGLAGADSVHLIGLKQGNLVIYGGSEPLIDLSENYRTALVNAVDQTKSLIINQESTGDTGATEMILSSLVVPLEGRAGKDAMLFRKGSAAFKIDERQLKLLAVFGHLGRMALTQDDSNQMNITRRKGFEAVLKLLKPEGGAGCFDDDPGFLMRHLLQVLPASTAAATFRRDSDGSLRVADSHHIDKSLLSEFSVLPGEGELGRVAIDGNFLFLSGQSKIASGIEVYSTHNRSGFQRLMGERGLPPFMALCPLVDLDKTLGVVVVLFFDLHESQRSEWERLLTLVTSLYSLRQGMVQLQTQTVPGEGAPADISGPAANDLNNHLSAVIGNAELVSCRTDIPEQVRVQLREIISEAEKGAASLRDRQSGSSGEQLKSKRELSVTSLDSIIKSVLENCHISGNLYMTGERPHEIDYCLEAPEVPDIPREAVTGLINDVLDRIGFLAGDDDIMSIVTYEDSGSLFMDFSRHHENFPPVKRVAGFGKYQSVDEALVARPSDVYLKHLAGHACSYAVDLHSSSPAYLSFKFAIRGTGSGDSDQQSEAPVRLLAIDDQAVILDLISAMGNSLGYRVDTASSGEKGIQFAQQRTYDVVLTDLAMPDISGLEVARRIHIHHPSTPIILVTGWEANIDKEQLKSAGIKEVLYKPFRIEQLTDIVQASVSNRVK